MINAVVQRKDGKILVVKRSPKLRLYPGQWNGIGGFLDDHKSVEQKVKEELREELGIAASAIRSFRHGAIFDADDTRYRKTFVVHPVLVELRRPISVRLDWEASAYRWVAVDEVRTLDLVPSFPQVLDRLFGKPAKQPHRKTVPPFSNAARSLKLGIYKHFKGNRYEVLGIARHSETLEEMVIYRATYGSRATFVRPLKMFLETVVRGGKQVPRFWLVSVASS